MTNQARDLFLLSAVAYRNGKIEQAGKLYVAALSSEDAPAFLQDVQGLDRPMQRTEVSVKPKKKASLEHTVASIVKSMESNSSDTAATGVKISMTDGLEVAEDLEVDIDEDAPEDEDHYGASNKTLDSGTDTGEVDPDSPGSTDVVQSLSHATTTKPTISKFKVSHLELPVDKIKV